MTEAETKAARLVRLVYEAVGPPIIGVRHVHVLHDDGCPALEVRRLDVCDCDFDVSVEDSEA